MAIRDEMHSVQKLPVVSRVISYYFQNAWGLKLANKTKLYVIGLSGVNYFTLCWETGCVLN